MNFTREPVIETIISPKDGHKLLIRNSKGGGAEDYYVDAVEVVSFGRGLFFRSLERPKAFLVPMSDYEVLEVKEARVALKSGTHERNIKIGGGREAVLKQKETLMTKETEESTPVMEVEPALPSEETALEAAVNARMERRRDRRRHRRRRGTEEQEWGSRKGQEHSGEPSLPGEDKGGSSEEGSKAQLPLFSALIPPPPTLISETLSRYKEKEKESVEKNAPPEEEPRRAEKDEGQADATTLHRMSISPQLETEELSIPFLSSLPDSSDSYFF